MLIYSPARRLLLLLSFAATVGRVSAQPLPEGPIGAFDGRVVVRGEVIAAGSSADDIAYFNYTDYEHNALRMVRLGVSGVYRPASWLAFVGEVRSEDLQHPTAYAAYARVRPWRNRPLDIQAGRIPPVFGAFGRRIYGNGNPVIGYPLAYQYLTSLRPDAIPATADDLLRMRARGWRSNFPVGSTAPGPGMPLVSAFQWDTGVQVSWKSGALDLAGAVTNGTLSNPRMSDNNNGKQLSARVAVTPTVGLILGASAARGSWLSRTVTPGAEPAQRALGADLEYSRDHWIVRGEAVWSRFAFPTVLAPSTSRAVDAMATWIDGRYRVTPRIFLGARADRLSFSELQGSTATLPWDAPVTRLEWGAGYFIQRNFILRVTAQSNRRDAGRVRNRTYIAGQLAYWF